MIQIETEKFEGPLDLLLQLIEKEKLDICEISLAKITDNFVNEISHLDKAGEEIAEFLVIAAKLLYIKSKQLLPSLETEEEESEIADLEAKLLEYQRYKKAAQHLEEILKEGNRSFKRRAKNERVINFLPPSDINQNKLYAIFEEVINKINEDIPDEKTIETEKITIEDKRENIRAIIKSKKNISFKQLLLTARHKTEVIVTFLALLEMIKQKEVKVLQNKNFADFTIEKI